MSEVLIHRDCPKCYGSGRGYAGPLDDGDGWGCGTCGGLGTVGVKLCDATDDELADELLDVQECRNSTLDEIRGFDTEIKTIEAEQRRRSGDRANIGPLSARARAVEIATLANQFNTKHATSKLRVGAIITHTNALADSCETTERQRDEMLDALREVADIYPLNDLKRVQAVLDAYDDPDTLDERLIVHNPKPRWT